ncbi:hypothetical protein [Aquimarina sp. 433]
MSKILHDFFLKKKRANIVRVIFHIKEINESFIHYFTTSENISQFNNEMNVDDFEFEFSKISGDPGSCANCFKDYLKRTQSSVIEKKFNI